jgi:hypothetical protein
MTLFNFGKMGAFHMTEAGSVSKAQRRQSCPGQVYFAGTGPHGKTCSDCAFAWRKEGQPAKKILCRKFEEFMGRDGPLVPARASSCKYFAEKAGGHNDQ